MGTFRVAIEIARPGRRVRWTPVGDTLVDSGADYTWVPEEVLDRLGIPVFKKDQVFVTADGRHVIRDIGIVLIRHGQFKTVDEVVFARPGDLSLLGAHTLEGFNATVHPRLKRLVPSGPLSAAAAA